jgi:hypothetical protein
MTEVQKEGRPTKFTRELGNDICRAIARVGHEYIAAELCGVHRHTVRSWRKRGDDGEEEFQDFSRELRMAKAAYIETKLPGVKSMEWLLERFDTEVFGSRARVEHTGKDGGAIEQKHNHSLSHTQSLEIVGKILGVNPKLIGGKFKGELPEDAGEDGGGDE